MWDQLDTRAAVATERERDCVIAWRRAQLLRSGFPQRLAMRVAHDGRYARLWRRQSGGFLGE